MLSAKVFSRSLVVGILLVCAACSNPASPSIRFGLANLPVNLDPRFTTDAAATRIGRLIYQRLVEFDQNRKPIPGIANWQQVEPLRYRFTLLSDKVLPFHNGKKLTANDVRATYLQILDEKVASPHRAILNVIDRIETPDQSTIDFYLKRPDPLFPAYLVIGIMEADMIASNHNFDRSPVGSGPFRFDQRPDESKIRLTRIADRQTVEFIHVPNPTVRVLKLLRGEIDLIQNDLPPELVRYLAQQKNIGIQRASGSNFAYLGINFRDPILQNVEIRKAIAYAIDRNAIIKYLFGDLARPANTLLPPDHWASREDLSGYEYNPMKAKQMLRDAGYEPGNVSINYKTSSDPFRIRVATIIQSQLAQAGIKLQIHSYDWGTFYGDIKAGRFQIYSLAWIGIKTPDIFRYTVHSESVPPVGANRGFFNQAEIDHLIEQAEAQTTIEQQSIYYQQLQSSLLESLPYIPLWYENHISIFTTKLQGYHIVNDGSYDGLETAVKSGQL